MRKFTESHQALAAETAALKQSLTGARTRRSAAERKRDQCRGHIASLQSERDVRGGRGRRNRATGWIEL